MTTLHSQDLFRLAFSEPVQWLTGAGIRQPVHWVATSLQDVQPGDLLLLPGERVDAKQLAQAQRQQAATVLIVGECSPFGHLPERLPIAVLAGQPDLRAVQQTLLTLLINEHAALMERGVRIHAQLSQLAAEGEGLAGLAHAIASLAGRGVLIQDKRLRGLADQPSLSLQQVWEQVLKHMESLDSLPETLRDRKQAGRQPGVITQELPGGLTRLIAPITVGGMARGYLSLVSLTGELDALDEVVIEQGALVCAVEMARNKAVREAEKRLEGDLLTALLQENLSPRDARLWAEAMGLDLTQAHTALRFAWDGPSPPSRRRLETLVNGEVTRLGLRVIISLMGTDAICFCQDAPHVRRPDPALALGQAVLDQAAREYPDTPVRCGIGTPAQDLNAWGMTFRQAGQALEMARRFGEHKALYFPDLSVYRLLLQLEHKPELMTFQEEILGPLLSDESGRDLVHTLEAYFEHNGNLSQTAESLFIHRNTLIYRMDRIAKITSLDLDNPETRLTVQLALHIYRMMGRPHA